MPFSKKARSLLSEQFAEIYQATQDEYRRLLSALRDANVDLDEFTRRVNALSDRLLRLKRIHEQLVSERDELRREAGELRRENDDLRRENDEMRRGDDDPVRQISPRARQPDEIQSEGGRPMAS